MRRFWLIFLFSITTWAQTIVVDTGYTLNLLGDYTNTSLNINLNGGRLNLNGFDLSINELEISRNSILDFGNGSSMLTTNILEVRRNLDILNWTQLQDQFYTFNFIDGVYDTPGIRPMNRITFASFSQNDTTWRSFDNSIVPVIPEPTTYGAMVGILLVAASISRRRKRAS